MRYKETDITYLDSMIDAYASVTAYVNQIPELEMKIARAYSAVVNERAEFDSFNALLGRSYPQREQWIRHVAWIAQHSFALRAHCVGNKILLAKDHERFSPIVDQLEMLGFESYRNTFSDQDKFLPDGVDSSTRIDSVLVDVAKNRVLLIKGFELDAASRRGSSMPLFDSVIGNEGALPIRAPGVASLAMASNIVRTAFRDIRVVPVAMLLDGVHEGWRFRAFSLEKSIDLINLDASFDLAASEEIASSSQMQRAGIDLDELRYLPSIPASNVLNTLPVDRATRCLMMLELLWNRQREVPQHLAVLRGSELGNLMESHFHIAYPNDLRRHDIEDCLERNGLIERPAYEGNAYALTPRGVARTLLMKRLFVGSFEHEDADDLKNHVLSHISKQSRLWAQYRAGQRVCA